MTRWDRFRWWRWTQLAQEDARANIRAGDERITRALGPRPVWDPVGNAEHRQVTADLQLSAKVDELKGDMRRVGSASIRHPNRWGIDLRIATLFVLDVWGAALVARSLGLEGVERVALGLALAAALIYLTRRAATPVGEEGGNA